MTPEEITGIVNTVTPIILSIVGRWLNKAVPTDEEAQQFIKDALEFHLPDLVPKEGGNA